MSERCQTTTVDPNGDGKSVWCELPHGHAGKHHAELPSADDDVVPPTMDWSGPPEGVWLVAGTSWSCDGPGWVTPYPAEMEALRAVNETDYLRAYFVPFGEDLREVMS